MIGSTFEDILTGIGCGPWNWFVFVLSSSWGLLASLQALSSAFLAPTTDFECSVPELTGNNWTHDQIRQFSFPKIEDGFSKCLIFKRNFSRFINQSFQQAMEESPLDQLESEQCHSWIHDTSVFQSTVVMEWDLVCERQYQQALVQSTFMLGFLIGAPIGGILADKFGRKKIIALGFYLCVSLSFLATFAPHFEVFLVLRFLMAVCGYCVYQTSYILVVECSSLKRRGLVGLAFCIPFALGYMLLPGIAYLIRDWRTLHLTLSIMVVPLIGNTLFLPESPRWLIQNGRAQEAEKEIEKALKWNGKRVDNCDLKQLTQKLTQMAEDTEEPESPPTCSTPRCEILSSVLLRKYCLVLTFIWFTSTMVYYGLSLHSVNLSGDPFVFMFLGGLIELPCYTVVVPVIVRFGRRPSLLTMFCVGGIAILVPIILPADTPGWWLIAFNLFAKLCITSAFQLIFLYSSEVFPTNVRTQGVGLTNLLGRGGATASPFITGVLGHQHWALPSIIFGVTSICSGLLVLLLPETNGRPLPDSAKDVQLLVELPERSAKQGDRSASKTTDSLSDIQLEEKPFIL